MILQIIYIWKEVIFSVILDFTGFASTINRESLIDVPLAITFCFLINVLIFLYKPAKLEENLLAKISSASKLPLKKGTALL